MGGVDKNNAMGGNYSCIRKTYKWTTNVFFHFLEAIFNSFLLYSKNNGKKQGFWNSKLR